MRCKSGHEHPPMQVVAPTGDPTNQPRPYHCAECYLANRPDKVARYWKAYDVAKCRSHASSSALMSGLLPAKLKCRPTLFAETPPRRYQGEIDPDRGRR
jgi:hypothetical protein